MQQTLDYLFKALKNMNLKLNISEETFNGLKKTRCQCTEHLLCYIVKYLFFIYKLLTILIAGILVIELYIMLFVHIKLMNV